MDSLKGTTCEFQYYENVETRLRTYPDISVFFVLLIFFLLADWKDQNILQYQEMPISETKYFYKDCNTSFAHFVPDYPYSLKGNLYIDMPQFESHINTLK